MSYRHVFLALFATQILYLLWKFYVAFYGPLSHIPGPLFARCTRLWEINALRKGDFERRLRSLHDRYGQRRSGKALRRRILIAKGPVVCVRPNRCSIDDPRAIKIIYRLGPNQNFPKSEFYNAFSNAERENIFTKKDPKHYAGIRRRIGQLYLVGSILGYERFVDRCSDELEERLQSYASTGQVFEICRLMQFYAFDVIGAITVRETYSRMVHAYLCSTDWQLIWIARREAR